MTSKDGWKGLKNRLCWIDALKKVKNLYQHILKSIYCQAMNVTIATNPQF